MAKDKTARGTHKAPLEFDEAMMTTMKNFVTKDPQGGRRVYTGQRWGPSCNHPEGYNMCLTITFVGNAIYLVNVGLDIREDRNAVYAIIDAGIGLYAFLVSDDTDVDRVVATLPLKSPPVVSGDNLSAEFEALLGSRLLDEDSGRDELYGLIRVYDAYAYRHLYFRSGIIADEFAVRQP